MSKGITIHFMILLYLYDQLKRRIITITITIGCVNHILAYFNTKLGHFLQRYRCTVNRGELGQELVPSLFLFFLENINCMKSFNVVNKDNGLTL